MDWYWDSAYRQVMKKINPDILCITEFYSADWIIHSKTLADSVLPHEKTEEPLIVQIFWKDPANFAKAAKIIEQKKYNISWIDVNMWCPAKKVVKSWHGSGLMINEDTAFKIIEELNKATKLPISVKTRIGFDKEDNLINFAKWLENAWASLITVHWRTAKQAYTWIANWEPIYELKKHLKIPIIWNGDVKNYEDWLKKLNSPFEKDREISLDWFMIWRATFWNPWVFLKSPLCHSELVSESIKNTNNHLINSELNPEWQSQKLQLPWKFIDWQYYPTLWEILEIMHFHADKLMQTKWERKWSLEIRKHLVCYLKNFPWVKTYRKKLVTVESLKDVENVISEIKIEFKDYLWVITKEIG